MSSKLVALSKVIIPLDFKKMEHDVEIRDGHTNFHTTVMGTRTFIQSIVVISDSFQTVKPVVSSTTRATLTTTPIFAQCSILGKMVATASSIYNNRVSQLGQSAFGIGHQPVN